MTKTSIPLSDREKDERRRRILVIGTLVII
jgi:hypothetical protein